MLSGDSGSVSSVGVTWTGEADTLSHDDVDIERGGTNVIVGVVACGVANGGVAGADISERSSSFSSSWSRSSSTSFRLRLVLLAGGG
jgi:hydroxyethylthiazole kinase-like sugar kinase family protein